MIKMATFLVEGKSEPPRKTSFPVYQNVNNEHVVEVTGKGTYFANMDEAMLLDSKTVTDKEHCYTVGKILKNMQEKNLLLDLVIHVGKTPQKLMAHRCILAANSNILHDAINTRESELTQNSHVMHTNYVIDIHLNTDSVEALEEIVKFMYTGELTLNPSIIEDILHLAAILDLQGLNKLENMCCDYLDDLVDITNWMWLINIADKYNFGKTLKIKLLKFACENFAVMVQSNEMLSLEISTLCTILTDCNADNDHDIEACKMDMILKWLDHSIERLIHFVKLITCINKNCLYHSDLKNISERYQHIICGLDSELWVPFVKHVEESKPIITSSIEDVKYSYDLDHQEEISDSEYPHVVNVEVIQRSVIDDMVEEEFKKTDDSESEGFESDNTLPYEKEEGKLRKSSEKLKKNTINMKKNEGGTNEICYSRNKTQTKRKVSHTLRSTPMPKKMKTGNLKNVKGKVRTRHTSLLMKKFKKPRMKTSFTQVNQDAIQDEFQEIALEEERERQTEEKAKILVTIQHKQSPDDKNTVKKEADADYAEHDDEDDDDAENLGELDEEEAEYIKLELLPEESPIEKVKILRREKKVVQKKTQLHGEDASPTRIKRSRTKKATTEAEMFACEKCPRKFATPSALKHHMKGHGANQPFLCEICGFSTIHFASMNVHKRKHNDQLRFHCQWPGCDYTAIRRSRLDDHFDAHQGIKNHVCSVCGKAFAGRKHLHRHEQLHKGDKLRCAECPYESPRRDKLRDHIKKHHPATAIMHGFLTKEEYEKPRPLPKPRKPRPSRSKKGSSKKTEMDANAIATLTALQLKEERIAEDQEAVAGLEENVVINVSNAAAAASVVAASAEAQSTGRGGLISHPGYITLPPHLFTGSTITSEEVIQYITNMAVIQPPLQQAFQQPTMEAVSQQHSPNASENMIVSHIAGQPTTLHSTAAVATISVPPVAANVSDIITHENLTSVSIPVTTIPVGSEVVEQQQQNQTTQYWYQT